MEDRPNARVRARDSIAAKYVWRQTRNDHSHSDGAGIHVCRDAVLLCPVHGAFDGLPIAEHRRIHPIEKLWKKVKKEGHSALLPNLRSAHGQVEQALLKFCIAQKFWRCAAATEWAQAA